jgi:hypothetical protein
MYYPKLGCMNHLEPTDFNVAKDALNKPPEQFVSALMTEYERFVDCLGFRTLPFVFLTHQLTLLDFIHSNEKGGKYAYLSMLYETGIDELGVDFKFDENEDYVALTRVDSLIRMKSSASAGFYYPGKHRDLLADEIGAAQALLEYLDQTSDNYLKKLRWCSTAKVVNKIEVYPNEKRGKVERIIYATNTFFYLPLQMLLKCLLKCCTRSTNSRARLLYPFSPARGGFSKLISQVDEVWRAFVYSDNVYMARREGDDLLWISLDGSKMEGSHNLVSAFCLSVYVSEMMFGCVFRRSGKGSILAAMQHLSKAQSMGEARQAITSLELQRKPPRATIGWLRYTLLAFIYSVTTTGVLGSEQFIVPGMASGVAPTFFMNSFKMLLMSDRFLDPRSGKWAEKNAKELDDICAYPADFDEKDMEFLHYTKTSFEVPKKLALCAKAHGIKLKGELMMRAPLFADSPRNGLYPLDLLGHDLRVLTIMGQPTSVLVLQRERLLKLLCFSKPKASGYEEIEELTPVLYQLLNLVRYRTAFVVGGWNYPELVPLLFSLMDSATLALGNAVLDPAFQDIMQRTIAAVIDPAHDAPWIDSLLNSRFLTDQINDTKAPAYSYIFRIYASPQIVALLPEEVNEPASSSFPLKSLVQTAFLRDDMKDMEYSMMGHHHRKIGSGKETNVFVETEYLDPGDIDSVEMLTSLELSHFIAQKDPAAFRKALGVVKKMSKEDADYFVKARDFNYWSKFYRKFVNSLAGSTLVLPPLSPAALAKLRKIKEYEEKDPALFDALTAEVKWGSLVAYLGSRKLPPGFNVRRLKGIKRYLCTKKYNPRTYKQEVSDFTEIMTELNFVVRAAGDSRSLHEIRVLYDAFPILYEDGDYDGKPLYAYGTQ